MDEFKSALIQTYDLTVQDHKVKANEELHSLRFKEHKETTEQFLDRFQPCASGLVFVAPTR
ncbi:hypothetical protein RMATCC62417_06769 [Rhizopus microsporus]|nr:hypothetical protein RMATCC62417_06769 [Rhizopus microsporus]